MVIYVVLVSFIINDFMDIQVRTFVFRIWFLEHEFRGAKVNEEEKKLLNESAGKILREAGLDFEEWKDYDWIKKEAGVFGYGNYYLNVNWYDEADASVYQKLINIDTVLGTDASQQLYGCLLWTDSWDIIGFETNGFETNFERKI